MPKMYEFSVNLDDKHVRVVAEDKLTASKLGAQALGVVWRERARDLVIIQGREIRRKELEKQSLSPSDLRSATSPRGRGKGAAAPGKCLAGGARPAPTVEKREEPTFKTGSLAGQPMKRKGR